MMRIRDIFQQLSDRPVHLFVAAGRDGKVRDYRFRAEASEWPGFVDQQLIRCKPCGYVPDWTLYQYDLSKAGIFYGQETASFAEAFVKRQEENGVPPECRVNLIDVAFARQKNVDLSKINDLSVLSDNAVFERHPDYGKFKQEQAEKERKKQKLVTALVYPGRTLFFKQTETGMIELSDALREIERHYFQPGSPNHVKFYECSGEKIGEMKPYAIYRLNPDDTDYYRFTNDLQLPVSSRNEAVAKLIYTYKHGYDADMTGSLPQPFSRDFKRIARSLERLTGPGYYRNRKKEIEESARPVAKRFLNEMDVRGFENLKRVLSDPKQTVEIGGRFLTMPERIDLIRGKSILLDNIVNIRREPVNVNMVFNPVENRLSYSVIPERIIRPTLRNPGESKRISL